MARRTEGKELKTLSRLQGGKHRPFFGEAGDGNCSPLHSPVQGKGPQTTLDSPYKIPDLAFPLGSALGGVGSWGWDSGLEEESPPCPCSPPCSAVTPGHLQSPSPPPSSTGCNLHPGGQQQGRASLFGVHQNKLGPNSARPALPAEGISTRG